MKNPNEITVNESHENYTKKQVVILFGQLENNDNIDVVFPKKLIKRERKELNMWQLFGQYPDELNNKIHEYVTFTFVSNVRLCTLWILKLKSFSHRPCKKLGWHF